MSQDSICNEAGSESTGEQNSDVWWTSNYLNVAFCLNECSMIAAFMLLFDAQEEDGIDDQDSLDCDGWRGQHRIGAVCSDRLRSPALGASASGLFGRVEADVHE
jgi:hypothetical protein